MEGSDFRHLKKQKIKHRHNWLGVPLRGTPSFYAVFHFKKSSGGLINKMSRRAALDQEAIDIGQSFI